MQNYQHGIPHVRQVTLHCPNWLLSLQATLTYQVYFELAKHI